MKIFVSIASYNDPTLLKTIRYAIAAAHNPESLVFGIGLQHYEEVDFSEFTDNDIKVIKYDPDTRPGITRIRYEISRLLTDEDFFVQVDSHYEFADDWDKILIDNYDALVVQEGTDKIAIMPQSLIPQDDGSLWATTSSWDLEIFAANGGMYPAVHVIPRTDTVRDYPHILEVNYSRVGQIFLPGSFIRNVGLDEYSHIAFETAYFSYRVFISGYRVFQLNEDIFWQHDGEYMIANPQFNIGNNENIANRFKSAAVQETSLTLYEMSLAFLYNKHSKYAVEPAVRTPEEFWTLNGSLEHFLSCRDLYDQFIHNNQI